MAMAAPPAGGGLEAKHYIMAALATTLVVAAVVTVVSIVMSPARLSFSVTEARNDNYTSDVLRLNLTLAAHNPSWRAAVLYQGFFVDVSNSSGPQWVNWMRADVSAQLPLYQRRRSNTSVSATVSIMVGPDDDAEPFTENRTSHNFSVMVTAVARFKVGFARTRLYFIKVYCGNVDFFGNDASRRADCQPAA